MKTTLLAVSIQALLLSALQADITPAALFTDNMVIQRETAAPVWGTADAGENIQVSGSWGQTAATTADGQGKWMVKLSTPEAGGPHTITLKGNNTVTLNSVLSGEVWLCSGQSNMEWTMIKLSSQNGQPTPIAAEIGKADYPQIREFLVKKNKSAEAELESLEGQWRVCTPKNVLQLSGTGYFFARKLYQELGIPVGIITSAWGGTPVESWTRREVMLSNEIDAKIVADWQQKAADFDTAAEQEKYEHAHTEWLKESEQAKLENQKIPSTPRRPRIPDQQQNYASTLYNAMIAPLVPYAIKGTIWYQGESNAGKRSGYDVTFMNMITDWRAQWDQGDFPFYFVQLANYQQTTEKFIDNGWSVIREAQRASLQLENVGMTVTIDIGESKDIHPRNKIEVGQRLAAWALAKDYGHSDLVYSGPLYQSAEFKNGKAILSFTETGSGLMVGAKKDVWSPTEPSDLPTPFLPHVFRQTRVSATFPPKANS